MAKDAAPVPLFGSVDLFGKPFTIEEGNLRKAQNLIPDGEGNLVRRGVMTWEAALNVLGAAATLRAGDGSDTAYLGNKPIWLSIVPFGPGIFVGMVSTGNRCELFIGTIGNVLTAFNTINVLMAAPELLPTVINVGGYTYIFCGRGLNSLGTANAGIRIAFNVDGSYTVTDFAFEDATNSGLQPSLALITKQRAWYANFGVGDLGSTVLVADVDAALTVGTNAITDRNFIIGGGDGDRIVGFKQVMLVGLGSPAQTGVLALKRHSAFLITGEPTETDDTDYFGTLEVNKISSNAGCMSNATICDTPWGTIWCGPDDVWFMPFGAVPYPIGRHIKPLLLVQPENQAFRVHAVFSGGFYRLALFSEGQGPNHETPLGEQWWLDLRKGPPASHDEARWYGPMVFNVADTLVESRGDDSTNVGTSFMCKDPRPGGDQRLWGVHYGVHPSVTAWRHPAAQPAGINVVSYDAPNNRDIGAMFRAGLKAWVTQTTYVVGDEICVLEDIDDLHPSIFKIVSGSGALQSGLTEPDWELVGAFGVADGDLVWGRIGTCLSPTGVNGSEALIAFHTKEVNGGSKLLDKLWQGMEVSVLIGTPERLQLRQVVDGGKTVETITEDLNNMSGPDVGSDYFGYDADGAVRSGLTVFSEEYQAIRIDSDEDNRIIGKSCQMQLTELPGIYLPTLTLEFLTINAETISVDLAASWYASVWDLAVACAAAVTASAAAIAALGGTFTLNSQDAGLIKFTSGGDTWTPSIGNAAKRFLWSLMGFTQYSGSYTLGVSANELAYDINVGVIGVAEGVIRYRTFSRRPIS